MTRSLVVGQGSIGRRHARVLMSLGCEVATVSRRGGSGTHEFRSVEEAVNRFQPGYVVLAQETSEHVPAIVALARAEHRGGVLVEKPLSHTPLRQTLPVATFDRFAVGYNLRFHPLLLRLRRELQSSEVISATAYAGQHLSTWRPGEDFRAGYSASASLGGGVLRDLSHEFDYLQWLLGDWTRVCALGGNTGTLGIDSDDCWGILAVFENCPVASVQLNYLDRIGQRALTILTRDRTLHLDFVSGHLTTGEETYHLAVDRDLTYRLQHEAMLFGTDAELLCTADEGRRVVRMIEATELAQERDEWVAA